MARTRASLGLTGVVSVAATVSSIWLGWQIVQASLAPRLPPELAVRIAPSSPDILRRAAESELAAGRVDNALALSEVSLSSAPFNARALRVWGLSQAQLNRPDRAVDALTLAGNWSLRDDPAHAWLFEYYLKRGNFSSAFAHADTLTRRRSDLHPQLFRFMTLSATSDRRGLEALVRTLAVTPPWRQLYLEYLEDTVKADGLSATLAIALKSSPGRFTPRELGRLYEVLNDRRQYGLLREVRSRLTPPSQRRLVEDPEFDVSLDQQIAPFGWIANPTSESSAEIVPDDKRSGNNALRVEYDGFGSRKIVEQLLVLAPGSYRLLGEVLVEDAPSPPRLTLTIRCSNEADPVGAYSVSQERKRGEWRSIQQDFTVPAQGCPAQWLRLEPDPGERRSPSVVWLDKINVGPVGPSSAHR